ncbi:MAG: YidC/Oxa1 family insertase periplasmic-domain containing protein [Rubripirellula sp.]
MERRLLTFIVTSTAFFLFYAILVQKFAPPPPPELAQQNAADAGELADAGEITDAAVDGDAEPVDSSDSQSKTDPGSEASASAKAEPSDEPALVRPTLPEWMTLGSMDPATGYYMLVTLNSTGGGIERVELTERVEDGGFKYRRVDVRYGYLGYLAATNSLSVDGVEVHVVGPGTPAADAGVEIGDVIVAAAGQPIISRDDLTEALKTTKPGETVSVEVLRGGTGTPIVLKATLSHHPLDVIRLARDGGDDQVAGNLSQLSCLMTLGQVNRKGVLTNERAISGIPNPAEMIWDGETKISEGSESADFSVQLSNQEMAAIGGQAVRLRRSYQLTPGSYNIGMSVAVDNLSDEPQDLAYRLEGANGLTLEGWWYSTKISPNFSGAAARDIVYKNGADGHVLVSGYDLLKRAKNEPKDPSHTIFAPDGDSAAKDLKYLCVDAQYFVAGFIPSEGQDSLVGFRRAAGSIAADADEVPRHQERAVNTNFFLDSVVQTVPANSSVSDSLQFFVGPKEPELLDSNGLGDCIYYGWFSWFAKILGHLLHLLSNVGNYAVAIILLTLLVRGMMFPLSRKAAVNAQKMQELAPELKKINDKYKDDMEAKLKAQRDLQKKVGFNPLAGCLPMFLQLPIFIGLYRALSVDIELRQEAVSGSTQWASNLAGPDMFTYWGDWLMEYLSGRGTGWLGPYFNVLPVLVVVLFLAQQKMFMPPATDEQTAMTQKMMNIMTLMMGLFFFRVPAGLCIYFITSSLWGICERILVKKTLPPMQHFDLAAADDGGGAAAGPEKSQSIADRIRSQVSKPEPEFERPNKRKRPKKK